MTKNVLFLLKFWKNCRALPDPRISPSMTNSWLRIVYFISSSSRRQK